MLTRSLVIAPLACLVSFALGRSAPAQGLPARFDEVTLGALAVFDDGSGPKLYAGGNLSEPVSRSRAGTARAGRDWAGA